CLVSVFFFQAEDGIRDDLVTGVQTCALPIYPAAAGLAPGGRIRVTTRAMLSTSRIEPTTAMRRDMVNPRERFATYSPRLAGGLRSEERRVGKGCGCGGGG